MRTSESHAIWNNAALAVDTVSGVGLIAYAARSIPPAYFGTYVFALTVVELLALLDLGISAILPRALIEAIERRTARAASALVGAATKAAMVMAVSLAMLSAATAGIWYGLRAAALSEAFMAAALVVVAGCLFTLPTLALTRVFEAERRFPAVAKVSMVASAVRLVIGVTALYLGYGVTGLAAVYAVSTSTRCLLLYMLRNRVYGSVRDWARASTAPLWGMLRVGKWSAFDNALRHVFFRGDVFVIGALGNTVTAAVVGIGRRVPNLLWQSVSRAAAVTLPAMARAHVRTDHVRGARVFTGVSARLTQVGLPVVAICWLAAPEVIRLWVGDTYAQSAWVMRWAIVGVAVLPLSVPATNVLYGANEVRESALAALAEVAIVALVAPLVIWRSGPIGLVPVIAVTHVCITLLLLVPLACRAIQLSIGSYFRTIALPALSNAGVIAGAVLLGGMLFPEDDAARMFSVSALAVWMVVAGAILLYRKGAAAPINAQ